MDKKRKNNRKENSIAGLCLMLNGIMQIWAISAVKEAYNYFKMCRVLIELSQA